MSTKYYILHERQDGVSFGVEHQRGWDCSHGEFIFFHDYTAVGDGYFTTKMGLDVKQMDLVMEWWQQERSNFITEEN